MGARDLQLRNAREARRQEIKKAERASPFVVSWLRLMAATVLYVPGTRDNS